MAATHHLRTQARCMVAHAADEDRHGFLVGTASLRGPNELRLLRYYEDEEEIEVAAVYSHPGEIAGLSACPEDAAVVLTVSTTPEGRPGAAIWRMPDLPGDSAGSSGGGELVSKPLERVADFPEQPVGCRLLHAQFCPPAVLDGGAGDAPSSGSAARAAGSGSSRLLSVDDTHIRIWELRSDGRIAGSGSSALRQVSDIPAGDASFIGGTAWDRLHPSDVAVACDASIHVWDTRTGERTRAIERAVPAGSCVRGLSYNCNKPWHLASGGDDCRVKIWDLRKTSAPVKVLEGHTHWVTAVAFNAFHDQLVLSGGADGRVNLWRASSVSSAPLLELGDDEIFTSSGGVDGSAGGAAAGAGASAGGGGSSGPAAARRSEPKMASDAAIRAHEEHEDSVYSVAWSAASAWVYASLSYQGRLTVAQVPSAEKYKILL